MTCSIDCSWSVRSLRRSQATREQRLCKDIHLNQRVDELLDQWEERREAGCHVTVEELCADCPELLAEVRSQIRTLDAVESRFGVIGNVPVSDIQGSKGVSGATEAGHEFTTGEQIDVASRFRIVSFHARGGLGSVFLADDLVLNRRVAIKIPRSGRHSAEAIQRFEREAAITGQLDHPGIVPVYSMASLTAGRPCYVMRFVEGRTLAETLSDLHDGLHRSATSDSSGSFFSSLIFRQTLQQFVSVCNIAAFAHQKQVIHRDIKPANILFGRFGEVLLLDWGLARRLNTSDDVPAAGERGEGVPTIDRSNVESSFVNRKPDDRPSSGFDSSSPTRTGQIMGTPAFASPEQLLGRTSEIDHRSDIYSLGATLLALLTGKLSFERTGFERFLDRIHRGSVISAHEFNSAVPAGLEAICRQAMAINPSERYSTVADLTMDLERWLAGEAVSVLQDSLPVRATRLARRHPRLAAAAGATLSVVLISGLVGSTILARKNHELSFTNDRIKVAMSESQSANAAALAALRSMFDDVIARKFSERVELSKSDLRFLEGIRRQYEAFASLKCDSIESREIQAEGVLRSGQILHTLAQQEESRRHFEKAVVLYEALSAETRSADVRDGLIDALSNLAMMHHEYGDMEALSNTALRGISLVASARRDQPESVSERTEVLDVRLHQELGFLQETRQQYREAIETNRHSVEVLERLLKTSPQIEYRTALARNYRSLGEMCRFLGQQNEMQQYSTLAVRTARDVLAQDPDTHRHQIEFGWALYDASFIREQIDGPAQAEPLLTEAIELIRTCRERYPLIGDYLGLEAALLNRRAAIRDQLPDRSTDAIADLQSCMALLEPQLNEPGTFQNARPGLRALNRLLRIHRKMENAAEVTATAARAVRFSMACVSQYPQLASDSELRELFEHFAAEAEIADPHSAERLRQAIAR